MDLLKTVYFDLMGFILELSIINYNTEILIAILLTQFHTLNGKKDCHESQSPYFYVEAVCVVIVVLDQQCMRIVSKFITTGE